MTTSRKKPKVTSGRRNAKPNVTPQKDLLSEAVGLRIDFVRVDIEIASTFVSLARFDIEKGESEHASQLLFRAQRTADVIGAMLHQVAMADAAPLKAKLRVLMDAIHKAQVDVKALPA